MIEGNRAISSQELSGAIGSTAGQPYSDLNVAGDRDNVLTLYYDQGFPNAQFHALVDNIPAQPGQGPRVNLTYQIEEGEQIRVAQVLVGGYEHTHPSVIIREVQLHPGGPFSESAVVETQRRLYNLGIFSRVAIAPQDPEGSGTSKTIDLLVDEARRYTIGYGLGFEAQRLGTASSGPVPSRSTSARASPANSPSSISPAAPIRFPSKRGPAYCRDGLCLPTAPRPIFFSPP